jgi:dihydropyrimidinase
MPFDTLVLNGTVHTVRGSSRADIAIKDGLIAAVGSPGSLGAAAGEVFDASGMDVIPGCLDVHVHLALPFCGTVSCDDFDAGSRAAASGGITTVIDFAIPGRGESLADADAVWHAKSDGRSIVDYAWHLALTDRRHLAEIPAMVRRGLPTFKAFMIYESEGWNADDAMLFAALEACREHAGMLLLHAESPRVLDLLIERRHHPDEMRRLGARLHALTRPNFVEAEAIERAIHWSSVTGGPLYIVHLSTAEGADLVRDAQARGVPVLAETCVQYLVLDDTVFDRPDGHLFACCPQVKKPRDVQCLWSALSRGSELSVVSTDTCSFTRQQKGMWWNPEGNYGDWTRIPMGLPGLDTMVPLMYTLGVQQGRLSINRLVELCATNPARLMGLAGRKGDIAPGFDADLAIIDPRRRVRVVPAGRPEPATLHSRADWSPYEGMELAGFAHTTLVRGTPVVRDHSVVGAPGHGRFLERRGVGHH